MVLVNRHIVMSCYSYTVEKPAWEDISQGQEFRKVAGNYDSDAIWALTSNDELVKYDDGDWVND